MDKSALSGISTVLPFDADYIKVEKSGKWNLMDSEGKLISDTWFNSISKNSDGSIVTEIKKGRGRGKPVTVKFISTKTLAKTVDVIGIVPVHCIDFLDSGSIEAYTGDKGSNYIAKAKLYGRAVYIDKDGGIYDDDGTKLRLLFNTVDSERLYKAVNDFNRRLHYDCKLLKMNGDGDSSYDDVLDNHISMWSFYWVTEDWNVKTDFEKLIIGTTTKKWTDALVVRCFTKLPGGALDKLIEKFGKGIIDDKDSKREHISWNFDKGDLDKIINTLNSI